MVALVSKDDAIRPVHVFILGVSRYRHLEDGKTPTDTGTASGLEQLSSAARSASEFAAWILDNIPEERLASLYFNASPSENETLHPDIRGRLDENPDATRDNVVADWESFYTACDGAEDATVYIYVAGHGVQMGLEGAILLLEDFGIPRKPKLWAALDLVGMSKTLRGSEFPHLQYWFIDCCREQADAADYDVAELQKPYVGFDVPEGLCKAAPIFFASFPREQAWARPGGLSLFSEGLLEALREDAATPPESDPGHWCVTTSSLARVLTEYVAQQSGNAGQKVHLAGHMGTTNEVLHEFPEPPRFNLRISLRPAEACDIATANIDQNDTPIVEDSTEWPLERKLPGGMYIVRVNASPDYGSATKADTLTPQKREWEVTLR